MVIGEANRDGTAPLADAARTGRPGIIKSMAEQNQSRALKEDESQGQPRQSQTQPVSALRTAPENQPTGQSHTQQGGQSEHECSD
jgi:hypothetical protein